MPERLPTSRFLVLSAAVHAAAFGVLGYVLVTPAGVEPRSRIEVTVSTAPLLEEPLPALPSTAEATLPAGTEPAEGPEIVEAAATEEAGDPRFSAPLGGDGVPDAPGLIGVGAGGYRLGSRRAAVASAPEPEPPPPPPPPSLPEVRARPVPGACAAPQYPSRERRLGVEGVVEILVRVAADGAVESAEVETSSGSDALDGAALAAVRGWRFEPAVSAGVAVPDAVVQRVRFRLVSAAVSGR